MAATIDSLVGCLLVATWINSIFYGIQLTHLYKYFKYYQDEGYMRVVVLVLCAVDIAGVAGQFATVYLDAITHYGNKTYLNAPEAAPRGMYLVSIQLTGAIVQCYLITRIWRLSKNIWVALVLWAGALLALGGGLGLTIINLTFKSLADRSRQGTVTSIWLVTAAVVDVLIAVILVFYLWKAKQRTTFAQTHNVLRRLMASSLETGSLTALLAIVVEVLFQKLKQTNLQVGVVWLLGRAYCITMTYNLLQRRELRKGHTHTSHFSSNQRSNDVTLSNIRSPIKTDGGYPIEISVAQTQIATLDHTQSHHLVDGKNGFAV